MDHADPGSNRAGGHSQFRRGRYGVVVPSAPVMIPPLSLGGQAMVALPLAERQCDGPALAQP